MKFKLSEKCAKCQLYKKKECKGYSFNECLKNITITCKRYEECKNEKK